MNILLVEDDAVDVMNVRRAFTKNHLPNPLFVAGDGVEALQRLRGQSEAEAEAMDALHGEAAEIPKLSTRHLLILLDLNMPRMGGIEFLQELRRDPQLQFIPVIVLTTSNEDCDRVEAYRLNVAGYILKPVTFSNFSTVVATLSHYWSICELP